MTSPTDPPRPPAVPPPGPSGATASTAPTGTPAPFAPAGAPVPFPQPGPPPPGAFGPPDGPGAQGPVIIRIGELAVTSTVVHTPTGDIPLAGSRWQVADYWHTETRIPTWAKVAAVVGFCVLTVLSLLFLLARETVRHGTVQVTVTHGGHQYVARIPVADDAAATEVYQQVNYVRSLAAL